MADELALKIPLEGDVSPISAALENMKSKVASAMHNVRDAMGAVGLMAVGFLKGAIDEAAEAQSNMANLEQTLKSTGNAAGLSADQITDMASRLSEATTFDDDSILKGQNMLLTFTNIKGEIMEQASEAMLDLAQKYGTDPANQAIALGKALNDPIKGVTALSRVGVTFTEQQKDQIKAMQDVGNMAGAQSIILKELNTEFGGQAQAATKTYAGQMKQLGNTFANIKESIGSYVLPYLQKIGEHVKIVLDKFNNLSDGTKEVIAKVLMITAVLGPLIGGVGLVQRVMSILGPVVSGLGGLIGALSLPILAVIAGIALLTLAYTKNFGGIKDVVDDTIGKVIKAFQSAIEVFHKTHGILQTLQAFISGVFGPSISGAVIGTVIRVITIVKENIPKVRDIIQQVFSQIKMIWQNILMPTLKIIIDTIKILVGWIVSHWPDIQKAIQTGISIVVNLFNTVLIPAFKFVITTIQGVVSWITANWPLISNTIKIVLDTIWSIISLTLGKIQSFWNTWGQTIIDYVSMAFNNIKIIISTVIKVIEDIIKAVMLAINGDWTGAWNALIQAVKDIFGGVGDLIKNILNGLGTVFGDIVNVAVGWGSNMIDGFIRGITGGIQRVKDAVGNVMKGVKDFLGFNSPSKEGEGQHIVDWGANMISGFMSGIKNQLPAMKELISAAIPNISANVSVNNFSNLGFAGAGRVSTIIVPVNLDGKTIAKVTAPYSDKVQGKDTKFKGRGQGIK